MNDSHPVSTFKDNATAMRRHPVLFIVAACAILIVVLLGIATWWDTAPPPQQNVILREPDASRVTTAEPPQPPASPPVREGMPEPASSGSPAAIQGAKADSETVPPHPNPPTLLEAMMRTQTERASSATSPFRHEQNKD